MAYTLTDIAVPEFHFDIENNTASAVRVVRMEPWSELDQAVEDLAGGSLSFGQLVIVTQPVKYPGKPYLWLLDIKAKPFYDCVGDPDANSIPEDPTGAELTLTYRTPKFDAEQRGDLPEVPADTYLTVERNMSLEYASEDDQGLYYDAQFGGGDPYTPPGNSVFFEGATRYYGGGAVPIDAKISSQIAIGDIRVTWHRVKNPPWKAIDALQGTVNDAIFMNKAPEQVLFVGVHDVKQFQTDGTTLYQLTYQFSVRVPKFKYKYFDDRLKNWLPAKIVAGGWNHYPRKGTSGEDPNPTWQKVYRREGTVDAPQEPADLLFVPADFRKLFQPDPSSSDF